MNNMVLCTWCGLSYRTLDHCITHPKEFSHQWSLNTFRVVRSITDLTASFSTEPRIEPNVVIEEYNIETSSGQCVLCATPYETK